MTGKPKDYNSNSFALPDHEFLLFSVTGRVNSSTWIRGKRRKLGWTSLPSLLECWYTSMIIYRTATRRPEISISDAEQDGHTWVQAKLPTGALVNLLVDDNEHILGKKVIEAAAHEEF